VSIRPELDEQT